MRDRGLRNKEAARTAFADCTGLPDTLDSYANMQGGNGYGIYGEWLEMPLGNALFQYEMAGWEISEDGKGIDVTLDEINAGLKFFITGAEEVE